MEWVVEFYEDFKLEFDEFELEVKRELLARLILLQDRGLKLKRPYVDTLSGSNYPNMKELRFDAADGVWRIAFAFNPKRCAVLLFGGDKSGVSQDFFYKQLIKKADKRFKKHLLDLEKEETNENNSEQNVAKSTNRRTSKSKRKSKGA
jgi:hypothetical protein